MATRAFSGKERANDTVPRCCGGGRRGRRAGGGRARGAGHWGGNRGGRLRDKDLDGRRLGRDGCQRGVFSGGKAIDTGEHHNRQEGRDREVNPLALAQGGRVRASFGDARFDVRQFERMFVEHFVFGHAAGPHGFVKVFEVDAIHVPDDDGQHGQQGLAAVRGLGRRDELTGQEFCGRYRIPHQETGETHHHRAPHKSPVFGFFFKGVTSHLRAGLFESQVVEKRDQRVFGVLQNREHGHAAALDENLVADHDDMVDRDEHHHGGGSVMDGAQVLDAAEEFDEGHRGGMRGVFLRQAGESQCGEREQHEDMLDALRQREPDVRARRLFLGPFDVAQGMLWFGCH